MHSESHIDIHKKCPLQWYNFWQNWIGFLVKTPTHQISWKSIDHFSSSFMHTDGKRNFNRHAIHLWKTRLALGWVSIYITETDMINALPGKSSVNTIQHATLGEAVLSVSAVTSQQWTVIMWHVFRRSDQRANRLAGYRSRDVFTISPCPFLGYMSKAVTSYE
jgi:hypothetical protein